MTKDIWVLRRILKGFFNVMPDKENEEDTVRSISSGVVFRGSNLWILIFAIFIASLGLNVNSTAVIIGAMLISPLMGPIIGMGLAVGINDLELLRRAAKNYAVATVISVLTAMFYFLITPLNEAQSELLARTSPTLYDVLIALCGGAAGILAISTKGKGNVIPGVAIATALMPPLCTAGYGLAMGNAVYFFGAFYLFFINTVFICLATFLGVRMMKFSQKRHANAETLTKVRKYIVAVVLVTMIPAVFMTMSIISKSIFENNIRKFVKSELSFKGTQVIANEMNREAKTLSIVIVGKEVSREELERAELRMSDYGMKDYKLSVIQGTQSDSLLINKKLSDISNTNAVNTNKLLEQSTTIHTLEQKLLQYTKYEGVSREVAGEIKVLFPYFKSVGMSRFAEADVDSVKLKKYVLVMAETRGNKKVPASDISKLRKWLKSRLKTDSIRLVIVP